MAVLNDETPYLSLMMTGMPAEPQQIRAEELLVATLYSLTDCLLSCHIEKLSPADLTVPVTVISQKGIKLI